MTEHNLLGRPQYNSDDGGFSLAVLSLSCDPRALALGPQLAIFAASQGIPTALVIGPQQDTNATAGLRTASAVPPSASSKRPNLLRVTVSDDGNVAGLADAALIVVVVVVDGKVPEIPDTMRTTATVIGVSAGAVTADQLARTAVVAAADGREITGILVADPDSADRTNGRIPRSDQPVRRKPSARPVGIVTEIRRLTIQVGPLCLTPAEERERPARHEIQDPSSRAGADQPDRLGPARPGRCRTPGTRRFGTCACRPRARSAGTSSAPAARAGPSPDPAWAGCVFQLATLGLPPCLGRTGRVC